MFSQETQLYDRITGYMSFIMNADADTPESAYFRSFFHVGGHYVDNDGANDQHEMTGQMYVEKLLPVNGIKHPWPLVLIHGAGQTGTVSSNPAFSVSHSSHLFARVNTTSPSPSVE
jgi:hypothetical protein